MANQNTNEEGARAQLARLGWQGEEVEKVLRGPTYHSLKEIAGPQTDGWEIEQGADESNLLPHGDTTESEGMGQRELVSAVWQLLHGDPTRFLAVSSAITELPGQQQAYLLACVEDILKSLDYLTTWQSDFRKQRDERGSNRQKREERREHLAVAVLEAAAKAEADLPVIGTLLSYFLTLGIEIREALLWSLPSPIIEASRLVERVEGEGGVYAGLDADKEAVEMDAVASLLKSPDMGIRYPFVPSLESFKREAERLLLYPHQPNAINGGRESYTWVVGLRQAFKLKPGTLRMTLQGSEMGLAEVELVGIDVDESGRVASGTIAVGEPLGRIESGTLRLSDDVAEDEDALVALQRTSIEYVGVVRVSDQAKWRATNVGQPMDQGRYPLLRFEDYQGDFEAPSEAAEPKDVNDGEDDGGEGSDADKPAESEGRSEPVSTIEIFGMLLGLKVPLAVIYRPGRGVLPGAKVLIAEQPDEGFGYAGKPGRWREVYADKRPDDFGLPTDLAVVVFDGKRAWPVKAQYLAMLYGDKWQSVIMG